ncbi:MAG: type II toxin-antitoxin system Phd/YefM family antitoxin [Anaerolineae bacterium]
MKIVVSVNELATETQMVIDNMRRSNAPVLIGDPNKPMAVLLSLEEYERLLRQTQKATALETTQPVVPPPAPTPAAPKQPAAAEAIPAPQPTLAEVIPVTQHSDIAQRTAAAIQGDRSAPPEPKVVSQRPTTLQPDPTSAADRATAQRGMRLAKPLPKPPRPLEMPKPRRELSLAAIPGGWQTIALVIGVLVLGILGFALIVNAIGG